jgi:DNA-binding MarR family transcriptional regulator
MKEKTFPQTQATPARRHRDFVPPPSVSHPQLLINGSDMKFREMIYLMFFSFGRLQSYREAFGRAISLTGSQFIVLIGTARQQGGQGVSIRELSDHTHLASTHVTTEVGRLIRKGLLTKSANPHDRRGVLVRLSPAGEAAILEVSPLLRRVNDVLFRNVTAKDLATILEFLSKFAHNSEYAEVEIRQAERERDASRRPRGG